MNENENHWHNFHSISKATRDITSYSVSQESVITLSDFYSITWQGILSVYLSICLLSMQIAISDICQKWLRSLLQEINLNCDKTDFFYSSKEICGFNVNFKGLKCIIKAVYFHHMHPFSSFFFTYLVSGK